MEAVVRDSYGTAVSFGSTVPLPVAANEVLVRVHAAGVDRGTWHVMTGLPYRCAVGLGPSAQEPGGRHRRRGTVVAVGSAVTGFTAGDEVFGMGRGSFAAYAAVREDKLAIKPANLSFEQAAVVPISARHRAAGTHGRRPGQAWSEGTGRRRLGRRREYAVQLAKAFGAEVTGVCSTAKVDLVASLGADHVIDYTRDDFADGSARYDLVLDIGGNTPLARLRGALTAAGTLVIVGGEKRGNSTGGFGRSLRAPLLSPFVSQRLTMLASKERASDLERLTVLIEAGTVTPSIDRTYPLERVPDAMRHLEADEVRGKVAIIVGPP